MSPFPIQLLVFAGAVLALVVAPSALKIITEQAHPLPVRTEAYDSEEEIIALIKARGGEKTYHAFGVVYAGQTVSVRHQAAHSMGEALFAARGAEGVTVCDDSFSYGCYHGFFGRAIATDGLAVIPTVHEICKRTLGPKASSCQHGVGHGLVVHFGYERENLDEALPSCDVLDDTRPAEGCYGGAYMEYNLRTMHTGESVIRKPPEGNMYDPCDTVASRFAGACYFWQPQWWFTFYKHQGMTTDSISSRIGELCRELPLGESRSKCISGFGNDIAQRVAYDPPTIIRQCVLVASSIREQLTCRALAASSLYSQPQHRARAEEICDGLVGDSFAVCRAYSQGSLVNLQSL